MLIDDSARWLVESGGGFQRMLNYLKEEKSIDRDIRDGKRLDDLFGSHELAVSRIDIFGMKLAALMGSIKSVSELLCRTELPDGQTTTFMDRSLLTSKCLISMAKGFHHE